MAFQLVLTRKAEKALDKLSEDYQLRIVSTLRDIRQDPYQGKKLSGKREGQYSVRVWPYRIIYSIEKKELVIVVVEVDDRKDVYK